MVLMGLTGGIGMGKSSAGEIFSEHGIPVADTDIIARNLVEPGKPALKKIQSRFGAQVVDERGRLRRSVLAELVFSDANARLELEALLHPLIRENWLRQTDSWRSKGERIGVVIIPLLFETQAAALFDRTLCVACSVRTQRLRLEQRGWSETQSALRIAAQMPVSEKIIGSDYVIWTDCPFPVHARQIARIIETV